MVLLHQILLHVVKDLLHKPRPVLAALGPGGHIGLIALLAALLPLLGGGTVLGLVLRRAVKDQLLGDGLIILGLGDLPLIKHFIQDIFLPPLVVLHGGPIHIDRIAVFIHFLGVMGDNIVE